MKVILAVVSSCGEMESDELFETKDQLTEELSLLIAQLVADGAEFEDALDDFSVFQQVSLDKEFIETVRKEVDLEVPLVLKKQRDQAFDQFDKLMDIAKLA